MSFSTSLWLRSMNSSCCTTSEKCFCEKSSAACIRSTQLCVSAKSRMPRQLDGSSWLLRKSQQALFTPEKGERRNNKLLKKKKRHYTRGKERKNEKERWEKEKEKGKGTKRRVYKKDRNALFLGRVYDYMTLKCGVQIIARHRLWTQITTSMSKSPVLDPARKIRAHNIMYPGWQHIKIKQMHHSQCAVFTQVIL